MRLYLRVNLLEKVADKPLCEMWAIKDVDHLVKIKEKTGHEWDHILKEYHDVKGFNKPADMNLPVKRADGTYKWENMPYSGAL